MGGEMKRCPHCGAKAWLRDNQACGWRVECDDCQISQLGYTDRDAAIAAWNRRSPDPELVEALTEMVRTCRPTPIIARQGVKALNKARTLLSRIREGGEG